MEEQARWLAEGAGLDVVAQLLESANDVPALLASLVDQRLPLGLAVLEPDFGDLRVHVLPSELVELFEDELLRVNAESLAGFQGAGASERSEASSYLVMRALPL